MAFYVPVNPELITTILNSSDVINAEAAALVKYQKYKASDDALNIQTRQAPDYEKDTKKPFPRLNHDFRGDVIDTKTGYMVSIPIAYNLQYPDDASEQQKKETDVLQSVIDSFNLRNTIPDLDAESVKMTSICGYSYRKLKIGTAEKPGVVLAENLNPWEVVYLTEKNNDDMPLGALYHYTVEDAITGLSVSYAEFYDDEFIYFFMKTEDSEVWSWDTRSFLQAEAETEGNNPLSVEKDPAPVEAPIIRHMFADVPIIKFKNNEEMLGDCDKAAELIDNYDELVSDQSGELMSFAHAYLGLYGLTANEEELKKMKQSGAFQFTADGKAEFITKDINDSAYMNQIKTLERNILRFCKTVDFTDENFHGNLTKLSIRFKIYNLEMKAQTLQLKMMRALRRQYKLLASIWNTKGVSVNYLLVDFVFTRNVPVNLLEEAETQQKLQGVVSEETRLAQASFIADPIVEMEKMEQEAEANLEKYGLPPVSGEPATNTDDIEVNSDQELE